MNQLNSIIVEGNLVADPELSQTPGGTSVGKFRVGNNRYYKNSEGLRVEESNFFDVETWGRLADTCSDYLQKGRGVRVVGRLKQDRWVSPDGEKRSRVKIVGEHVEFMNRPRLDTFSEVQVDETAYVDA